MTLFAFVAALAAFALFALATDPHALTRLGARPRPEVRRLRRTGAWALLALAFVLAVAGQGWVFGPVAWFGIIMFASGAVFLALNLLPPSTRIRS